jgi:PAS domain S-box-containing protein
MDQPPDSLTHEGVFRELADSIAQLAWIGRPDGWIYWYNRRWYEYTGTTPAEMQGWGWQSVHDPAELPRVLEHWAVAIEVGKPYELEFPLRRADGQFRWFLTRATPSRDARGAITAWFGTNTDITEQRSLAQERLHLLDSERAARLEAERASRLKDDFLATLSHELRTPLTAILGWSQLVLSGTCDEAEQSEGLRIIQRNARLQAKLIDDLLDMSRILAGKMRLDLQSVDLAAVIESAVLSHRLAAAVKGIRLESALDLRHCPARPTQPKSGRGNGGGFCLIAV